MRHPIGSVIDPLYNDAGDLDIDLPALVVSRLLIQASSGGGKSFLLRRLLEQTHGAVQQIVIDVEGEFASLREKFDYVLASKDGGDTTADPRTAALLAQRLLELKASAIVDISELSHPQRVSFVKLFVEALIDSPKALWHSALIVIDEAQMFCPQDGKAESTLAVMNLCTRGRKRGFAPVLATQRLSQLNKNAAAECLNRFIGRTSLDVDMKRAGDELGFDKTRRLDLRKLKPGEFFAFGPALASEVTLMRVGPVVTKHPKAGGRIRFKAPPPTAHIKALLPKLSDLPAEVETKERTIREYKRSHDEAFKMIGDLRRQVEQRDVRISALEKRPTRQTTLVSDKQVAKIDRVSKRLAGGIELINALTTGMSQSLEPLRRAIAVDKTPQPAFKNVPVMAPKTAAAPNAVQSEENNGSLSRGNAAYRLLRVLKTHPGATDIRLGALAGISAKKSTFRVGMAKLRSLGYAEHNGVSWTPTSAGLAVVQDVPGAPTGAAAIDYWRTKLGRGAPLALFDAILACGEAGIALDDVSQRTSIPRTVSTFRVALAKLKQNGLVNVDPTDHATINGSLL